MHVLIADADPKSAASMARHLRRSGIVVDIAADPKRTLALAASTEYDVIVLDFARSGPLHDALRRHHARTVILTLLGPESVPRLVEHRSDVDEYLHKPFEPTQLVDLVRVLAGP